MGVPKVHIIENELERLSDLERVMTENFFEKLLFLARVIAVLH